MKLSEDQLVQELMQTLSKRIENEEPEALSWFGGFMYHKTCERLIARGEEE